MFKKNKQADPKASAVITIDWQEPLSTFVGHTLLTDDANRLLAHLYDRQDRDWQRDSFVAEALTGLGLLTIFGCKPFAGGWDFYTPDTENSINNIQSVQSTGIYTFKLLSLNGETPLPAPIPRGETLAESLLGRR